MRWLLLLVLQLGVLSTATAQVPVPFVNNTERFVVFHRGRFEELEPRLPKRVWAMEGQVVFVDAEGRFKVYEPENKRTHLLDRDPGSDVRATRHRIAWRMADTLKTLREGRALVLQEGVERYEVSDSLIVFTDTILHQLGVIWKGKSIPLADLVPGSERPVWMQGSNTVAFFNKEARTVFSFYRGKAQVLCDSTDVGIVATGGDVIGYWDGNSKRFMALYQGRTEFLSDLRPVSAQAGNGLLAFVDGNGRLKCFANGAVHTVMNEIPSGYWVKDSSLVYLDNGRFMLFNPQGSIMVENYVPERWMVEGSNLVYLDINRELRGIINGERVRFGSEAAIASFELFGSQVLYRSPLGNTVVATPKRTYLY